MFTGIVEALGEVVSIGKGDEFGSLELRAPLIQQGLSLGDSVATDGVCLTVSRLKPETFVMDVMPISWQITTLGGLQRGDRVNLERALKASGRLGGHFVTGHVDSVGVVQGVSQQGNASLIQICAEPELIGQLVAKGSIAVSGISLTVHALTDSSFGVSIIPHTVQNTILQMVTSGQRLNLETDILGKYCQALLRPTSQAKSEINAQFLQENGFF